MKIMQLLTVLLLSLLVLGCGTTSIKKHSSASNVDDEWAEGISPGESNNLDPKWYWDEAWKDENSVGSDLLDEVKDEVIIWAFEFLAHQDAKDDSWDKGVRYLGVIDQWEVDYVAPSEQVFRELRKKFKVRSCSELRFPKDDEMDPKHPERYRAIENAKTGQVARLYFVRIIEVLPGNRVLMEIGFTSGPLSGGGEKFVLEKRKGKWKILWRVARWVS